MDERELKRPAWWGVAIVVGLYLVVAVWYGVTIPIFETPDANGHYAYIHELTEGRGLPVQGMPSGERVAGYVTSHPPLYYVLCAVLTFWVPDDVDFEDWAWVNTYQASGFPGSVANKNFLVHTEAEGFPWSGTPLVVHVARLVSAVLGSAAVLGTYLTVREILRSDGRSGGSLEWLACGAAALTAFNPMFVFTGGRVSNDAAVAGFGALVIWGAVRLAVRGLSRRGLVLLGAALGLAVLSKFSGLTLAPGLALALLLDAARSARFSLRGMLERERLTRLLVDAAILFAVAALVCGWWFGRNLLLYGELTGVDAWLSHTETVRPEPIGLLDVVPQLEGLETSYWAMFGWFNVPVAPWMVWTWWVLVRLAVLGLLLLLAAQWTRHRWTPQARAGLVVVAFSFLLVFGSVWRFIMIVLGAQGRYLFPAIAAASTLLMLGLAQLVGRRGEPVLAGLLAFGLLATTMAALFLFILPTYARPPAVTEADLPPDLTRFQVTMLGTPIELIGGVIEAEEVRPGDLVAVSLYWRALAPPEIDYVIHVRLLGRDWERVAGYDGYPGGGNLPTSLWEPGTIYRDRYLLPLDQEAATPTLVGLEAGLREEGGAPFAAILPSGEPTPGLLLLDVVPLRPLWPPSAQVDYPVGAHLGESLTLVGADVSADGLRAGQVLGTTLVWRATAEVPGDYTVFVHLLDSARNLVAQADAPPLQGAYPTTVWALGEVVRDPHRLELPDDLPPGRYTLEVGLYDPTLGVRLVATDAEGNRFADDAIPITSLELR